MTMSNNFTIGAPQLDWEKGNYPYSKRFSDIYFSKCNGQAESEHVFLKGIEAPNIWQGKTRFVVGETGFGTGLNFLNTWAKWRLTAGIDARLYYVAVEGYPMTSSDILRSMTLFPQLDVFTREMIRKLPPIHNGFHTVQLDGGRVFLNLLYGPIEHMLPGLIANVDAWYLDGLRQEKILTFCRQR